MTEHSRALNIAGFSFIASLLDFTTMLSCGGSVYIANETERKNMEAIHTLFTKRKITGMFCPPQMYSVLQKLYGDLPLEYVILSGEKAQGTEYGPGVLELFGSSECFCTLLHPAGSGGPECLGKPCSGVEVWLLDEKGRKIEQPGDIGELCISSPWMTDGYNNLPKETAERFAENPFRPGTRLYHSGDQMAWDEEGRLIFHGRNDRMVKVMEVCLTGSLRKDRTVKAASLRKSRKEHRRKNRKTEEMKKTLVKTSVFQCLIYPVLSPG
jgi:acyl-coenzyme A synthetase/AMP-(fatty) acid ligase